LRIDEGAERAKAVLSPRRARYAKGAVLAVVMAITASACLTAKLQAAPRQVRQARLARTESLPAPMKAYGSRTAPITMEVFTDYECPMCRNLYEQTLRPMINDYVASGKVYLVHRDYPLNIAAHKYSGQAARWVNVAAQFGEFETVEAALYDNQQAWDASGDIAKYVASALSKSDFNRVQRIMDACEPPGPKGTPGGVVAPPHPCEVDPYIEKDIELGNQLPVTGTPAWMIIYKGQRLPPSTGFVSWTVLKQFFDNLLARG
jgi:protein-disulfide isomerase